MPDLIKQRNSKHPSWNVQKGKFFKNFLLALKGFDKKAKIKLFKETHGILAACRDPNQKSNYSNTGSVVGYVQSGKTTSFKALSMLALDNGYDFVIVLGGIKKPLLNQNKKQYRKLLEPFQEDDSVNFFETSSISGISDIPISNLNKEDGFFEDESKPLVTVILKHQGHLKKLANELSKDPETKKIISRSNTLIIDDEADNASLNGFTSKKKEKDLDKQTAVYRALSHLRDVLPRHSLVQYTATPQALLLTSRNDHYSPDWVKVISPGPDYIGGKDLFHDNSCHSLPIPESDLTGIYSKDLDSFHKLPDSFYDALYEFLLICCQGKLLKKSFNKNITMLVHPARETKVHAAWRNKIKGVLGDWEMVSSQEPSAWINEHKENFLGAYKRLSSTAKSKISKFNELFTLMPKLLAYRINVVALNASHKTGGKNQISWNRKFNIVIGADSLDRGFVVEGLTVTYMPRGPGEGNVDAIQQRGRFYGYKRKYLEFIRIRLQQGLLDAYRSYTSSEADLYKRLEEFSSTGKPFQEWERVMIMDPSLKPCRRNVIGIELAETVPARGQWYFPRFPESSSFVYNKKIFQDLINEVSSSFYELNTSWSEEASCMKSEPISLEKIIKYFTKLEVSSSDFTTWQGVKLTLAWLRDERCQASLYLMGSKSTKIDKFANRKRTISKINAPLTDIFQGANESVDYPGARNIYDDEKNIISIQIHKLRLEGACTSGEVLLPCLRIPKKLKIYSEI